MAKKLGLIQTRGLGDIIISIPIAHHYYQQGWEVYWPIVDSWVDQMTAACPWIKWIPVTPDAGAFFYETPLQRLKNFKCDEIIPLYQALTGQDFHNEVFFQHTKFDQYKYLRAGVPFIEKWQLAKCITRDPVREQALYDRLVTNTNYVVVHLEGSDHRAGWDSGMVPTNWQTIEITADKTNNIFDWLLILERAQSLVLVDSVFSNIVDQMSIGDDNYFIPRSHIGLTPVQANHWTWLDNPNLSPHAKSIGVPN
jgi:hypothetical protein